MINSDWTLGDMLYDEPTSKSTLSDEYALDLWWLHCHTDKLDMDGRTFVYFLLELKIIMTII